jgi:hypothetical protein
LKIKLGHIHKSKTTNKAMKSDTRPQTGHKKPEHTYLKFFTPLVPSVEKTESL